MRTPLALLIALVLAGCATDPPEPPNATTPTASGANDDDAPSPEPNLNEAGDGSADVALPSARIVTTFANGTITSVGAGASDPVRVCCPTAARSGENVEGAFAPGPDILGIVVEVAWADPTFDLDLWAYGPDYEVVTPPEVNGTGVSSSRGHYWYDNTGQAGAPDAHATITIVDPEELALVGEWGWGLTAKTSNATPFTIAVSLFYGEPPEDGFSALQPGGQA